MQGAVLCWKNTILVVLDLSQPAGSCEAAAKLWTAFLGVLQAKAIVKASCQVQAQLKLLHTMGIRVAGPLNDLKVHAPSGQI